MSRITKRRVYRSTILYFVIAGFLSWSLFFNDFTVGDFGSFLPYLPGQLASMSLDIILLPLLTTISLFYLASLISTFFEGPLTEVLVGSLYAAGFAAFFGFFLFLNPNPNMNLAGTLLLIAFGVVIIFNGVSTFSKMKEIPELRALAVSATIYVEGQVAIRLISLLIASTGAALTPELMKEIGQTINLGVSVAAVFTLFAVFNYSRNPYLQALGGMASNYLFSVSISLIGALYYGFFIGGLSTFAPSIKNLSPYVEWTGICVIAALIYTVMRRGMQDSIMVRNPPGEWAKHLQEVTTYKGDRFVNFTEIIDGFLEQGNKERLLVNLTIFLNENQVSDDEISKLLSDLINFEDVRKPILSRKGKESVVEKKNVERRLKVLQKTISKIVPTREQSSLGSLSASRESTPNVPKVGIDVK